MVRRPDHLPAVVCGRLGGSGSAGPGRKVLERRAKELRGANPGWVFRPAGPASELDDIGHLGFQYGPADQPPIASGIDIARTRDGVIIELYTIVTAIRQPS